MANPQVERTGGVITPSFQTQALILTDECVLTHTGLYSLHPLSEKSIALPQTFFLQLIIIITSPRLHTKRTRNVIIVAHRRACY